MPLEVGRTTHLKLTPNGCPKLPVPYWKRSYSYSFFDSDFNDTRTTPLKFNMEPKKKSLEKEIPFGNHHFQVPAVKFRGSNMF